MHEFPPLKLPIGSVKGNGALPDSTFAASNKRNRTYWINHVAAKLHLVIGGFHQYMIVFASVQVELKKALRSLQTYCEDVPSNQTVLSLLAIEVRV